MRVYRIEDEYGYGPFATDAVRTVAEKNEYLFRLGLQAASMPPAFIDRSHVDFFEKHRSEGKLGFAFSTLPQLLHYFKPEFLAELGKLGFMVNVYEVPRNSVHETEFQASFIKSDAELVETINY